MEIASIQRFNASKLELFHDIFSCFGTAFCSKAPAQQIIISQGVYMLFYKFDIGVLCGDSQYRNDQDCR